LNRLKEDLEFLLLFTFFKLLFYSLISLILDMVFSSFFGYLNKDELLAWEPGMYLDYPRW